MDEVTFANDKTATNLTKTIITESTVNVNTKYKSRYTLDSYINLIFAGNLPKLIECEGNERRYFALETNDRWSGSQTLQSQQYFKRIASTPPEVLRYFLSHRDISLFNPKVIPSSKALRDQKSLSLSLVNGWLHRCLVRGRILDFVPSSQLQATSTATVPKATDSEVEQLAAEWEAPIVKAHVYPAFLQYCKDLSRKATGENSFWKELYAVFPQRFPENKLEHRIRINGTQTQVLKFPCLERSRQLFREHAVHEATWSFEAQGETSTQDENAHYDDAQLGLQQVFDSNC